MGTPFYSPALLPPAQRDWYNSRLPAQGAGVSALRKAETIGPAPWYDRAKRKVTDFMARQLPFGEELTGGEVDPRKVASEQALLMSAGVAIPKNKMWYHGTTKPFKKFNPRYNDPSDLLGSMTHAAADPAYANEFARTDEWVSQPAWEDDYIASLGWKGPQSHIIPANARVKNAIDVSSNDPNAVNWKDLEEVLRARDSRMNLTSDDIIENLRSLEELPNQMMARGGKDWMASSHGAGKAPNKIPRNVLEQILADEPLALKDAGFDGVLYTDNIATSHKLDPTVLAVQNPAQLVSPYTGKPLGLNVKPENLGRVISSGGGTHLIEPKIPEKAFVNPGWKRWQELISSKSSPLAGSELEEFKILAPRYAFGRGQRLITHDPLVKAGKLTYRFIRRGKYENPYRSFTEALKGEPNPW